MMNLLLTALLFSSPARATITCDQNAAKIKPDFVKADAVTYCHAVPPKKCSNVVLTIDKAATDIQAAYDKNCLNINNAAHDIAFNVDTEANQKEQLRKALSLRNSLKTEHLSYIETLKTAYKRVKDSLKENTGPLVFDARASVHSPDDQLKAKIKLAIDTDKIENMKNLGIAPALPASPLEPSRFAAQEGVLFMVKILKATSDAKLQLSDITKQSSDIEAQLKGLDEDKNNPEKSKDTPSTNSAGGGSGLDLKSIAGLATAGAGLAQALKKQDSSINGETPPAATPPSNAAPSTPKEVAQSKFGDPTKAPPVGPVAVAPKDDKTDHSYGGGNGFHENSDISKNKEAPQLSTSNYGTPNSGKPSGGGGGGGSSGDNGSAGGKRDPSATEAMKKEDENLQGIGGGSLGGGGPPGGMPMGAPAMPGDPAPGTPEAGMQELLTDMKEAASEGDPNATPPTEAAADIAMTDEDLFPRVRKCLVRNLKLGKVLNGLGDHISENPQ